MRTRWHVASMATGPGCGTSPVTVHAGGAVRTNVESHAVVAVEPVAAFETVTQSLADALELSGVVLDAQRGTIVDAAAGEIGRGVSWHPGVGATLALHGEQSARVMLELTTQAVAEGTRIAVRLRGLDDVLGEDV